MILSEGDLVEWEGRTLAIAPKRGTVTDVIVRVPGFSRFGDLVMVDFFDGDRRLMFSGSLRRVAA